MLRQGLRREATVGILVGALFVGMVSRAPAVVINEINYHPPETKALEFVELYNPSDEEVAIGGWGFTRGIRYVFPASAAIAPRGYVVVCKNRDILALRYRLPLEPLQGNYASSLDNGGDEIVLVDSSGTIVDAVEYDNEPPWDTDADGRGAALERLCHSFDSGHPDNWIAEAGTEPTPLAANRRSQCPPPERPPPAIAINEIHYHPSGERDAEEEFVELVNNSTQPVDLRGYSFSSGIDFRFEESTVLEPGGFLVVCRNRDALEASYGVVNAVGNFQGQLSNSGERLTLVDNARRLVDSLRYSDHGEWPVAADGLGHSLERMVPAAVSDDPASWSESGLVDLNRWRSHEVSGWATSDKLLIYVDGESEFLMDNISLVNAADPGVNLMANGSFNQGIEGWSPQGNHADSGWQAGGGPDGSGALLLVANGPGRGSPNSVSADTVLGLDRSGQTTYMLSFDYRHLSGSTGLTVHLSNSNPRRGLHFKLGEGRLVTPGAANSNRRESLPPFVSHLGRFPQEPGSKDTTWISAQARGKNVARLSLVLRVNEGQSMTLEMRDDGLSRDGLPGDGVYGVGVPPQPHNSIVTFQVVAESSTGSRRVFPSDFDPTGAHGYYVNDNQPDSSLPVYTILLDHLSSRPPRSLIAALNCNTYRNASFAYKGDLFHNCQIRHRGGSVCGSRVIKRYLKLRFARGREFQNQRKLNLQSLWTDKSLIREHLAWRAFRDIGHPYCRDEFVRLHVNGRYFGLYTELEHPGKRFLERNGLNDEGNLYKAVRDAREQRLPNMSLYRQAYEKKTNEDGDFSDLVDLIETMHATSRRELVDFFYERMEVDNVIDYQMGQVLTSNRDYPHKNHYLYHDNRTGKWRLITWDMDLTFGKRWSRRNGGVLNDQMDNPGTNPWHTTQVHGGGTANHLLDKFFYQGGNWFQRAYLARLWIALQEKYTKDFYDDKIAFLHDLLFDEQLEDFEKWGRSPPTANDRNAPAEFEPNLERVRNHIRVRRDFLLDYLRTRHRITSHPRLKITEVMYNPIGGPEDGEFLELWNNSGEEIDISGWTIAGLGTRLESGERREFVFPDNTVIAADEVLAVAKNPEVFKRSYDYDPQLRVFGPYPGKLANGGEELRVRDAGPRHPATIDFLHYGSSLPWPPLADGLGYTLELTGVHENRDNDLPEYWRSSLLPGGTPGTIARVGAEPVFFRRGNCNGDSSVNITDAVTILFYLFRGGNDPPCLDGCDVDADRALTVSDAIFLLRYLFGTPETVVPFPDPTDCAPATGRFCERSNCSPDQ